MTPVPLFYLGAHHPHWLADARFADVPLFVSRCRLTGRKTLPRAVGTWALDSGGFTELQKHGRWTIDARTYVAEVRRFRDEIGGMAWAAPMDWMCEPMVVHGGQHKRVRFVGTGLTIAEHIQRTVNNFIELRSLAPDLPIAPAIQGWTLGDYHDCVELYDRAGVDLRKETIVGVGTMCRREDMTRAGWILSDLAAYGFRLHGFGFKKNGLAGWPGKSLVSADSMAWSSNGRRNLLPEHKGLHKSCSNCPEWALAWREELLEKMAKAAREREALAAAPVVPAAPANDVRAQRKAAKTDPQHHLFGGW